MNSEMNIRRIRKLEARRREIRRQMDELMRQSRFTSLQSVRPGGIWVVAPNPNGPPLDRGDRIRCIVLDEHDIEDAYAKLREGQNG